MQNFTSANPSPTPINISYSIGNDDQFVVCVKCQQSGEIKERILNYSKVSPVAYLAFLLGPIAALIVLGITSKNHTFCLPYCRMCWNRYRLASVLSGLSILLFCCGLVGGVVMMLQFDSGYLFWPLPVLLTVTMGALFYWKQTLFPRVKKVDKAEIIVDGGVYGDITFAYHGVVTRKL
jgi:hypothetical protein